MVNEIINFSPTTTSHLTTSTKTSDIRYQITLSKKPQFNSHCNDHDESKMFL